MTRGDQASLPVLSLLGKRVKRMFKGMLKKRRGYIFKRLAENNKMK